MSAAQLLKQASPMAIFCCSAGVKSARETPQGCEHVRITLVRSRATEKLSQGGAIITASTLPFLTSRCKARRTLRLVKSHWWPYLMSHWRATKPSFSHAAATPPLPEKRSAICQISGESKVWRLSAAAHDVPEVSLALKAKVLGRSWD